MRTERTVVSATCSPAKRCIDLATSASSLLVRLVDDALRELGRLMLAIHPHLVEQLPTRLVRRDVGRRLESRSKGGTILLHRCGVLFQRLDALRDLAFPIVDPGLATSQLPELLVDRVLSFGEASLVLLELHLRNGDFLVERLSPISRLALGLQFDPLSLGLPLAARGRNDGLCLVRSTAQHAAAGELQEQAADDGTDHQSSSGDDRLSHECKYVRHRRVLSEVRSQWQCPSSHPTTREDPSILDSQAMRFDGAQLLHDYPLWPAPWPSPACVIRFVWFIRLPWVSINLSGRRH